VVLPEIRGERRRRWWGITGIEGGAVSALGSKGEEGIVDVWEQGRAVRRKKKGLTRRSYPSAVIKKE
jgi:hypothetical protein